MASVENNLCRGLTVAQLIEELQEMEPDAVVLFTCDYGDHCHTRQALPIESVEASEQRRLSKSGYSHSGIAFKDDGEELSFYCGECGEERSVSICPKCKVRCVTEDGEPAPDEPEQSHQIVILS
jgi:hypothetical protein